MRPLALSLVVLTTFLLMGCEAPRDNPYDPGASNFIGLAPGTISGRVTHHIPNVPLADAMVYVFPGGWGTVSNDTGYYNIEGVPNGSYQLICTAIGFTPDTLNISLSIGGGVLMDFHLSAIPAIQDFLVTSHRIKDTSHEPEIYNSLFAQAFISEPDGVLDIFEVQFKIEALNFDIVMIVDPDSTVGTLFFYSISVPQSVIPGGFSNVLGKLLTCVVQDSAGGQDSTSQDSIMRVFPGIPPQIISPNEIVSPYYNLTAITLRWSYNTPPSFDFTFTTRIYEAGVGEPLFWFQDNIPAGDDSVNCLTTFNTSVTYFWTVDAVDVYGNSARSARTQFWFD